jgi:hypothetical protein
MKMDIKKETKVYNNELEEYLSEGINYQANTINKAERGDLEQLAADSFHTGWYKAIEYFNSTK